MGKKYCGFETVTMTPISTKLVDASMLTPKELSWLNAYNAEVLDKLQPIMEKYFPGAAVEYLKRECKPLQSLRRTREEEDKAEVKRRKT